MHCNDSMLRSGASLIALTTIALLAPGHWARATVTISNAATANMSCSAGVCEPTAANAVLNAGDLETMLASGNATVTTTGSGVEANDIAVSSGVSWSTANTLSLTATRAIAVSGKILAKGMGGLALTDDGGVASLAFPGGYAAFANLSSALTRSE